MDLNVTAHLSDAIWFFASHYMLCCPGIWRDIRSNQKKKCTKSYPRLHFHAQLISFPFFLKHYACIS